MKKTISNLLFAFLFSLICIFTTDYVSALDESGVVTNVWDEIGEFEPVIIKNGTFDKTGSDNWHNYIFDYDYVIYDILGNGERYIYDNGRPIVTQIYGISSMDTSKTIEYVDLKGKWFTDDWSIRESFVLYKYNFLNCEFDLVENFGKNKKGSYTIEHRGFYKLETLDEGQSIGRVTYLIYEPSTIELEFDNDVPFRVTNDGINKIVELNLEKTELVAGLQSCYSQVTLKFNDQNISSFSCSLQTHTNQHEIFVGKYGLKLLFNVPIDVVSNATITVGYNGRQVSTNISYDLKKPTIEYHVYTNKDFDIFDNSFEPIVADDINILSINSVAYLSARDENGVSEVYIEFINDEQETQKIFCPLLNNENMFSCQLDSNIMPENIIFKVVDIYGNVTSKAQKIIFDEGVLSNDDVLENYLTIENDVIMANFEGSQYSDIDNVCIFYGDSLNDFFECGYPTIQASYYYSGNINVLVLDKAQNYVAIKLENVIFENGYSKENFTTEDIQGDFTNRVNVKNDVEELLQIACGSSNECKENALVKVRYDEYEEELAEQQLPTYIEILNKKFKDSSCAVGACNKQVEIVIAYKIGEITQTVSRYYNYVDKLPYIDTQFVFNNQVKLEYGNFDIESQGIKQALYADNLEVTLVDGDGVRYSAKIDSVFVEYRDRNNNEIKLDDLSYQAMADNDNFGFYTLECRIKLLKNLITNEEYTDDVYAKSFFINVELGDTVIPTITLLGEKEINVKQFGAYKDEGYTCDDLSGCVVEIAYYLNEESNEVQGVDTKVPGKYIVKYVAIDGDGNRSPVVVRVVNVENMSKLDRTSIIVIVSIVGVFASIVFVAIAIEIKKSKKNKEKEEL